MNSIYKSISKSVFKSVHHPLDVPLPLLGGDQWASIAGIARSFALVDEPYYEANSPTTGVNVLRSREAYGTYRTPRKGWFHKYDGNAVAYGDTTSQVTSNTTDITLCGWVMLDNFPALGHRVIFGAVDGVAELQVRFFDTTKWPEVVWNQTGVAATTARWTFALANNEWVYFAATKKASNRELKLYFQDYDTGNLELRDTQTGGAGTPVAAVDLRIGADTGELGTLGGNLRDLRIYNRVLTLVELEAIRAGDHDDPDTDGLVAWYPCSEESGSTGYDASGNGNHATLTNVIHTSDTTGIVASNPANTLGHTNDAGVIIPADVTDLTLDAAGDPIEYEGMSAYPIAVSTPYFTSAGTAYASVSGVDLSSATSGRCRFVFNWANALSDDSKYVIAFGSANESNQISVIKLSNYFIFYQIKNGTLGSRQIPTSTLNDGVDHICEISWGSENYIKIDGVEPFTVVGGTIPADINFGASNVVVLNNYVTGSFLATGAIGDVVIELYDGTVVWAAPCQEGPGTANANRTIYDVGPQAKHMTITGGTVADIWAGRTTLAQDHFINYGGRIGSTDGEAIPSRLDGLLAADGDPLSGDHYCRRAGAIGNPYTKRNLNPYDAAELNGKFTNAYETDAQLTLATTPALSAFSRLGFGNDRILLAKDTLAGSDLANVYRTIGVESINISNGVVLSNDYRAFSKVFVYGSKLVAIWRQGREHPGSDPGGYLIANKSTDYGATWTQTATIVDSDPLVDLAELSGIILPNGDLLFNAVRYVEGGTTPGFAVYKSTDQGETFSLIATPANRIGSDLWNPWGDLHQLSDGTILGLFYDENDVVYIYESSDDGVTWTERSTVGSSINETAFINTGGSNWVAVGRDNVLDAGAYRLRYATSTDDCQTWSALTNSGIDGISPELFEWNGRFFVTCGDRLETPTGFGIRLLEWAGGTLVDTGRMLQTGAFNTDLGYPSMVRLGSMASMLHYNNSQYPQGIYYSRFILD